MPRGTGGIQHAGDHNCPGAIGLAERTDHSLIVRPEGMVCRTAGV